MNPSIQNRSDLYRINAPLDNPDIVMQGIHPAKLIEVRRFSNVFGERIGLVFKITGGTFTGTEIMDSAAIKSGTQGKLTDLLQGLGGDGVDLVDELIGRECHIAVKHERDKSGKTYAAINHTYP